MSDVARFLSKVSRRSALGDWLARDGAKYVPAMAKVSDDDKGFITRIWGIPVGFQFATGLGMEGYPALLLDFLSDPMILGPSFLKAPGSLLRAGRTGRAARGVLGAERALQLSRMGPAAARLAGEGFAKEQVVEALARGVSTVSRTDISSLRGYRAAVSAAADDVDVIKTLLKIEKAEQAEVSAALLTTRPKDVVRQEIESLQSRIDKLRTSKSKTATRRIDDLEKKKVWLKEELEVKPTPFREDPTKFKNSQLERVIVAANNGGKEGALAAINAEMRNRAQVRLLAEQMRKAPTAKGLVELEQKLLTLDPSPRFDTWFRQNKRSINELVEDVYSGRGVPAPLVRGSFGEQAAAGQRALLTGKIPFTGVEFPLVKGEKILDKAEEVIRQIRGVPSDKPLVMGAKRAAGLVQGATAASMKMAKILGATPMEASSLSVFRAAENAVAGIGPVFDDTTRFDGIQYAYTAEKERALFYSAGLQQEIGQYMRRFKMDPAVDGLRVMRFQSDPDKFLVKGGFQQVDEFGRVSWAGELTEAAKAQGFTEQHVELSRAIGGALQSAGLMLEREGLVDSFIKTYFPRRYKILKDRTRVMNRLSSIGSGKKTSTFFRHGKPRLIEHLDEILQMEKEGLVELKKDIGEVLQGYFHEAGRAAANKRLLQRMDTARTNPIGLYGEKALAHAADNGGIPLIARPESKLATMFADDYQIFHEPEIVDLAEAITKERMALGHKTNLVKNGKVLIHKDVARPISNLVLSEKPYSMIPFSEEAFELAVRANAAAKRGLLLWSMFHHMALTESGIATLGTDYVRFMKELNPAKALEVSFGRTVPSMLDAADLVDTATRHGLKLGAITDVEADVFRKTMDWVGNKLPVTSPATKALSKFEMQWNKGLWDFYHNSMKLFAFDTLYYRGLVRHGNMPSKEVAKAVAEHVNNAFGGQMWENFWVSPRGQKWLRLLIMAPDWTFSNLRVAGDVFANLIRKNELGNRLLSMGGRFPVSPQHLLRADVRATFARQYALRTGLIFGVYANFTNFALTGHYMDENPEGQRARIQLPWTDDRGRGQFLRFGKQFREPFEAFLNPTDFLKRKMAFTPNVWNAVVWNKDFFGRPIASIEDGVAISALKKTGWVARNFIPIPLQEAFGVGKPEARPMRAAFGAVGLPVKTAPNRPSANDFEALLGGGLNIPEAMGDLADELAGNNFFEQAMQNLSVSGIPPGF